MPGRPRTASPTGSPDSRGPRAHVLSRSLAVAVLLVAACAAPIPANADQAHEYHEVRRFKLPAGELRPGAHGEPTGFAVDPEEEAIYVADRTSSVEGEEVGGEKRTYWRIRKLSPEGAVLGTTTFTLPAGTSPQGNEPRRASAIAGLAVDHKAKRLYALVMGPATETRQILNTKTFPPKYETISFKYREHATLARELIAWSTEPNGNKELVAATGASESELKLDQVAKTFVGSKGTVGALIAGEEQLEFENKRPGAHPLYDPQGIVVDQLEAPGVDNPVAVEASDLAEESEEDPPFNGGGQGFNGGVGTKYEQLGDTVVQQVATQAGSSGTTEPVGRLLKRWSTGETAVQEALEKQLGGNALTLGGGPLGIFDDAQTENGKHYLSVVLHGRDVYEYTTNAYVVRLSPELTEQLALDNDAGDPEEGEEEEAIMGLDPGPFFTDPLSQGNGARPPAFELRNAGPEVAQLENGLYAADLRFEAVGNSNNTGTEGSYWGSYDFYHLRQTHPDKRVNIGVRMLEPKPGGSIAGKHGETIVNTLGGEPPSGGKLSPCTIDAEEAALTAGSGGALWALDKGPTESRIAMEVDEKELNSVEREPEGREIIELAPGPPGNGTGERACPQPSGTFEIAPGGQGQLAGGEVIHASREEGVKLDAKCERSAACSLNLEHEKVFEYRWEIEGKGGEAGEWKIGSVTEHGKGELRGPNLSVVEPTFTQEGEYHVRLRIQGDYGGYPSAPKPALEATIRVAPLEPPMASFTLERMEGTQLTFNAEGSRPGAGKTLADYRWNWGDGSPVEDDSTPIVTHVFPAPGTYTVTLTVYGDAGGRYEKSPVPATLTETVTSPSPPNEEPPLTAPPGEISPNPSSSNTGKTANVDRRATYVTPHATFAHGALSVKLSCPKSKPSCTGTIRVQTVAAFPLRTASAKDASAKRAATPTSRLTIGAESFALASGVSRTVSVRLTSQGAALLKRLRRLPVLVVVSAHDPLGDVGLTIVHLTLASAGSARRHA